MLSSAITVPPMNWYESGFKLSRITPENPDKRGTPSVYTDDNGVDLTQMINKVLIGAVPYYQATGVYLDGLLDRDNSEARNGTDPYTAMEHAWDEAFGYFGAARDYARYTDEQLAGKQSMILLLTPTATAASTLSRSTTLASRRNAGKRDKGGSGVNFTQEIFDAFLKGRTLITNQGTVAEISQQRQLAANGMEKVIAATVVHYINDTLSDMSKLGTADENRVNLNKHWAEMKGFTVALQYNPFRLISDGQLSELHGIMGQAPAYDAPRQQRSMIQRWRITTVPRQCCRVSVWVLRRQHGKLVKSVIVKKMFHARCCIHRRILPLAKGDQLTD